ASTVLRLYRSGPHQAVPWERLPIADLRTWRCAGMEPRGFPNRRQRKRDARRSRAGARAKKISLIAGPCVIESEAHALQTFATTIGGSLEMPRAERGDERKCRSCAADRAGA